MIRADVYGYAGRVANEWRLPRGILTGSCWLVIRPVLPGTIKQVVELGGGCYYYLHFINTDADTWMEKSGSSSQDIPVVNTVARI